MYSTGCATDRDRSAIDNRLILLQECGTDWNPMPLFSLELSSDPGDMDWHGQVQSAFESIASDAGIDGLAGMLLPSAVVEAINNVIEHAYEGEGGRPILVEAECEASSLIVTLRDRGRPMPQPLPSGDLPDQNAERGRGWGIIRSVFPEVDYQRVDGENQLRLARPLPSRSEPAAMPR
jgi:serine/threonine-protein kinase RsbW